MSGTAASGASDFDFIFKIVLVGDSAVGKSNLLLRFTRNEFRLDTQSTIGVEFAYKQVTIDGKKIKTQVWDTAGQERFKTVIPQFYRGSEGAMVVFDLTKQDSFQNVAVWVEEFQRHTPPDHPIVLVGNKSDLEHQRKVTRQQATELAEQLHLSYMETSALNATNVEEAFLLLVNNIYQRKTPKSMISTSNASDDHSHAPRKTVEDTPTVSFDEPIRIQKEKKSATEKKGGCCVIS